MLLSRVERGVAPSSPDQWSTSSSLGLDKTGWDGMRYSPPLPHRGWMRVDIPSPVVDKVKILPLDILRMRAVRNPNQPESPTWSSLPSHSRVNQGNPLRLVSRIRKHLSQKFFLFSSEESLFNSEYHLAVAR